MAGARFAIALGVAAALFAFEFFLAAPRVLAAVQSMLRERGGIVAPFVPLFAVLIYSFGVAGDWRTMLAGAAYTVLPALLVASSTGKAPGTWEDYAAVALLWLPVEFRWMYRLFPYPPPLTHTLAILAALSTSVAAFVLLRRLEGIGYAVEWRPGFGWNFAVHFALFAAIAIPIGIKIHFLVYDPSFARLRSLPLTALGILFFTAWPEEFLFRGLLQNFLTRTFEESVGGTGCRVRDFWAVAHSPCALSELEIRAAGHDRGLILRARVDENRLAAAGTLDSCAGGYFVAYFVSVEAH